MSKKIIILITVILSVLLLSSCSTSDEDSYNGIQTSANTFDFIIDETFNDFLVMGTSADYPPYQWLITENDRIKLVGIDIEIAKHIARRAGKNLRVINKGFDFLLEDLSNGRVDFVMSALSPTEERAMIVDFSMIYYEAIQVVLIQESNVGLFQSIDDLNNQSIRIGAQLGSIQQDLAEEYFPNASYQFIQSVQTLVMNLLNNQVKAVILEEPVALGFVNNNSSLMIADIEVGEPDGGSAAAVQKGNTELLNIINEVIIELQTSSELDQIIKDMVLLNSSDSSDNNRNSIFSPAYIELLLKGLLMTLLLSILAVILGSLLGLIPAFMRLSGNKAISLVATSYVEVIRGTPLLVQLLLIYSFVRIDIIYFIGIDLSTFIPGMLALLINSSAYISEIIRGGILSIDKGQNEAALSLGMTSSQSMKKVILPQAIKNILPSLGNEFVTLIKETSIFMYLGVAELMYAATVVGNSTYQTKEIYIVTAILYFILTFTTSKLLGILERKLKKNERK